MHPLGRVAILPRSAPWAPEVLRRLASWESVAVCGYQDEAHWWEATCTGPEVALVDSTAPGVEGTSLLGDVNRDRDWVRVLLVGDGLPARAAFSAAKLGALGMVDDPRDVALLRDLLEQGLEESSDLLRTGRRLRSIHRRFERLTDREREVLREIGEGKASKAIARDLSISKRTVDNHRSSILRKVEVSSVAELCCLMHGATALDLSRTRLKHARAVAPIAVGV